MNWTFFPRFSRSPAADSHLAPCWGQRRALVRLRPPQRDAADASLAGHLSSGACLVKQSHSQNIKYGKNSNCHLGLVYTTQSMVILGCVFFCGLPHYWQKKIQGVAPMLCTCFVFWSYLALGCTGGKWIQRKIEVLKIGYTKTFPVGKLGYEPPGQWKIQRRFPAK